MERNFPIILEMRTVTFAFNLVRMGVNLAVAAVGKFDLLTEEQIDPVNVVELNALDP